MEGMDEAHRQREQLDRYLQWAQEEGGQEGPTHLSTFFRPEQQARLEWLRDHAEGSIIELGCGYGFVLAFLDGSIGVDWNPRSIALARILNPRKVFVEADIRALPFGGVLADTVAMADCLEHIPWEDVPQALSEAVRVARKKVLITMPNAEYATRTSAMFKHQYLVSDQRFQELLNLLEQYQVNWTRNYFWVLVEVKKS